QKAALLLLDQPPRLRTALTADAVLQCTVSSDTELRQTALRIFQKRPEWAARASTLLERWLSKPISSEEEKASARSLVLAFQSTLPMQQFVGRALQTNSIERR